MYEQMRLELMAALDEAGMDHAAILPIFDKVATRYQISPAPQALAVIEEIPIAARMFIAARKVEGLSEGTIKGYKYALGNFFSRMQKPLEQITATDIRMYLYTYTEDHHLQDVSTDGLRGKLATFFGWATMEGYISVNPMMRIAPVRCEKKRRKALTQLQLERLRRGCKTPRDRAIVETLYSTGCRVGELVGIKLSDIDWSTRAVELYGKGKKHRVSYINARAEMAIKEYLHDRTVDSFFLLAPEKKGYRPYVTVRSVQKAMERISRASHEPATPHVIRHTTATTALQRGMPIEDIAKLLGHENLSTTMIYAEVSQEQVRAEHLRCVV